MPGQPRDIEQLRTLVNFGSDHRARIGSAFCKSYGICAEDPVIDIDCLSCKHFKLKPKCGWKKELKRRLKEYKKQIAKHTIPIT